MECGLREKEEETRVVKTAGSRGRINRAFKRIQPNSFFQKRRGERRGGNGREVRDDEQEEWGMLVSERGKFQVGSSCHSLRGFVCGEKTIHFAERERWARLG